MENKIKKLFIRTVVSFVLVIAIWLVACLLVDVNSHYGTALSIVSLIPCVCYIVYGTKLINTLGIEKFYPKL